MKRKHKQKLEKCIFAHDLPNVFEQNPLVHLHWLLMKLTSETFYIHEF
jgi:hypothetical protein